VKKSDKIAEAQAILRALGLPKSQQNEISALTLLALCGVGVNDAWLQARRERRSVSKGIMDFIREKKYRVAYAPNTRETIRRQVLHQLVLAGVVDYNPFEPDLPTNSPASGRLSKFGQLFHARIVAASEADCCTLGAMDYKKVLYEKHDRIAKVILNRPRYKNAQSRLLLEEMDSAFADANADDNVRVIILSGAGDNFCSGHDLGTVEEKEDQERRPFPKGMRGEYMRSRQMFLDNTLRWRDLDKPTIAQVHGLCIFGGWMFAAAMDLVVASDDAKFLPALLQYFSIPWDMPPRKAKEILFQSRFVSA